MMLYNKTPSIFDILQFVVIDLSDMEGFIMQPKMYFIFEFDNFKADIKRGR